MNTETKSTFDLVVNALDIQERLKEHLKFLKEKYQENISDIKFNIDRAEKIIENKLIAQAVQETEKTLEASTQEINQARQNILNLEKCLEVS